MRMSVIIFILAISINQSAKFGGVCRAFLWCKCPSLHFATRPYVTKLALLLERVGKPFSAFVTHLPDDMQYTRLRVRYHVYDVLCQGKPSAASPAKVEGFGSIMMAFLLASATSISVFILLVFHLYLVSTNRTTLGTDLSFPFSTYFAPCVCPWHFLLYGIMTVCYIGGRCIACRYIYDYQTSIHTINTHPHLCGYVFIVCTHAGKLFLCVYMCI